MAKHDKRLNICANCVYSEERNCELHCTKRKHKALDNETCKKGVRIAGMSILEMERVKERDAQESI